MNRLRMTPCEIASLPLGLVALGLVALTYTLERLDLIPLRRKNRG